VTCAEPLSDRMRRLMFWTLAGIWNALEVIIPWVEA
jgi:hypothetical protein